jgi:hypothetical protein
MSSHHQAFFSVILWPPGMDRDGVAELLSPVLGVDTATLRLRLGRQPPSILGLLGPREARAGVGAMLDAGGDAFAPAMGDIEALGPTIKLRDMHVADGGFYLVPWRAQPLHVAVGEVRVLVRATLRERQMIPGELPATGTLAALLRSRPLAAAYAWGGASGLALVFATDTLREEVELKALPQRAVRTSEKLDLHTGAGVFQIDGDKFGFEVLGVDRSQGDRVNLDRTCDLIAGLVPGVIIDPYFSLWRPPPGHDRLRLPQMRINDEDPAFAFYSRWTYLLYRHMVDRP